jgi:hypothetical protein
MIFLRFEVAVSKILVRAELTYDVIKGFKEPERIII